MILSFAAYIVSFVVFASSTELWQLGAVMFFFATGAAFPSMTHTRVGPQPKSTTVG